MPDKRKTEAELIRELDALRERVRDLESARTLPKGSNDDLLRSEQLLSEAQSITGLGIWEWEPQSGKLHWSDQSFRLLGWAPRAVTPNYDRFMRRVHPDDRSAVRAAVRAALAGEREYDNEHRIVLDDGSIRVHRSRAAVHLDDAGRPLRMVGVMYDVTAQRQSEARVRLQAQLLDHVRESVIATDLNDRVIYWGRGATRLYGYTAEEVLGRDGALIVPPEDAEDERKRIAHVLAHGVWSGQYTQWRKDGSTFLAETVISRVNDEAGRPMGFVGIDRDITDRVAMEEALRLSEARYRALAENFPNGTVHLFDRSLRFVLSEGSFPSTISREFYVGRTVAEVVPPDSAEIVIPHCENALKGRKSVFELPFAHGHLEVRIVPVHDEQREIIGGMIMTQNITGRKRAEHLLREHQAAFAHAARLNVMGEMAAGLAHELNQPLAAIAASTQACQVMLRRGAVDPERMQSALKMTADQANHAGEIIKRIREFARKRTSDRGRLNPNQVVREAVDLLQTEFERLQSPVELDLAKQPPAVLGDRIALEQVVINAVLNGLESMESLPPAERRLTIRTRIGIDGSAVIAVCDTGAGIDPEERDRIFDPFYSTKPGGMGIGLSICRTIAEAHGGQLRALANGPRGTTIELTLPPAAPRSSKSPRRKRASGAGS